MEGHWGPTRHRGISHSPRRHRRQCSVHVWDCDEQLCVHQDPGQPPQLAEILRLRKTVMFRRATVKAEGCVKWNVKGQGDAMLAVTLSVASLLL